MRSHNTNRLFFLPILAVTAAFLLASLAAAPLASAQGAELHVGPGQPYLAIQAAIDDDDFVIVHDGTYTENVDGKGTIK
ncbi:MAG: hypothetical protein ISS94_06215 [Candidatus Syntrophoarchaeum sp.]|nr:hypothetical protein [Candidatus Syntrophoarchaeum sp.]